MNSRNAMKAIAACSVGKKVRVQTPDGEFDITPSGEDENTFDPSFAYVCMEIIKIQQAQSLRFENAILKIEDTFAGMQKAFAQLSESVEKLVEENGRMMQRVAETLDQPVKPVYDDKGKLIGAQRVKKL